MSYYLQVAEQEAAKGNTETARVITELYGMKSELEKLVVIISEGRDILLRDNEILRDKLRGNLRNRLARLSGGIELEK